MFTCDGRVRRVNAQLRKLLWFDPYRYMSLYHFDDASSHNLPRMTRLPISKQPIQNGLTSSRNKMGPAVSLSVQHLGRTRSCLS